MACVRMRRGRYVLDYRDKWGRRRWLTFPSTPEGAAAAEAELERIDRGAAEIDPGITLGQYIERQWLPVITKRLDPLTARGYEITARLHLSKALLRTRLCEVTRPMVKRHLSMVGEEHDLGGASVAKVANVLMSIFQCAADDELIRSNPAEKLRKPLGIVEHKVEKMRAMDAAQLGLFMATVRTYYPQHLLEFAVLAYGGVRIGEMRGQQLDDLRLDARVTLVERQVYDDGRVGPVKGRQGQKRPRVVDVNEALCELLEPALIARRESDMRTGSRGPWLFYPEWGAPVQRGKYLWLPEGCSVQKVVKRLRKAMADVLRRARLPEHFTPHGLRHTFARVQLEGGEDLLYVSRQLGHASLSITADLYGHWARIKPKAGGANLLTATRS